MPPRSGAEVRSGGAFVGEEEVAHSLVVYDTIADELSTDKPMVYLRGEKLSKR